MKSSHECIYEGCDEPTGGRRYCIRHSQEIEGEKAARIIKEKEERKRLLKIERARERYQYELLQKESLKKGKTIDECEQEQKEILKKLRETKEFEFKLKTGIWGAICERITFLKKKKKELEEKGFETESVCREINVLMDQLRD